MDIDGFVFKKGHVFEGPEGTGYILTRDVRPYDVIQDDDFLPYGGAPDPVAGEPMANWLHDLIYKGQK